MSLHLSKCHIGGNLMSRLIYLLNTNVTGSFEHILLKPFQNLGLLVWIIAWRFVLVSCIDFKTLAIIKKTFAMILTTLLKLFKGTLRFCHWSHKYKCIHSPTHSKSWINKAKHVCPVISLVTFLEENDVIPFQKSRWNALCKNRTLLKKYLFFKTKSEDDFLI